MRISIVIMIAALAALPSCRRHHTDAQPSDTATTSASVLQTPSTLTGETRAVEAPTPSPSSASKGPDVGNDQAAPGAIVNVPALVGRSKEKVEAVLGTPESTENGGVVYRVASQPVTVTYNDDRAVWFTLPVPWPVNNAVDALRLLSIEAVNVPPLRETDDRVDYKISFSGVNLGSGSDVTQLHASATKPASAPDWTSVSAGVRPPLGFD